MKRLEITGPRRVEVVEVELPEPAEGEVLVRVLATAICAEHRPFVAGEPLARMGHEAVGELSSGERVVVMPLHGCGECEHCRAGVHVHCSHVFDRPEAALAQFLVKAPFLLLPLPGDVPPERAILACCALGPGFGALEKLRPGPGETVLVAGAGPVGLGAVVNARHRGLEVVVVEPVPERRALAERLGATAVAADPPRVDHAIECSGTLAGARLCIDATRTRGAVAFVGVGANEPVPVDRWADLIEKGLALHGAWHYNLNDYPRVLEVARSPLAEPLVEAVLPFSRAQEAFELAAAGTGAKVVLDPWA